MRTEIIGLLHKIDNKIYKLINTNGILETEDQETITYKVQRIVEVGRSLSIHLTENEFSVKEIIDCVDNVSVLLSLGSVEYKTELKIVDLLKKIREYIKGIQLGLELNDLESDDDIPDAIYESLEPFIDPDTGECEFPTDVNLKYKTLRAYQAHKNNFPQSMKNLTTQVTSEIEQLSITLNNNYQVDLGDGLTGIANPRIALQLELKAMQEATKHYFEPTKLANTTEVARVAQALYEKQAIVTDLSAGSFIIAACEALRSIYLLTEQRDQYETTITWQGVPLSLQNKPSASNLGNLYIRNVGAYGYREKSSRSKFDILNDFENVITYSGEQKLKSVIAEYGANPGKITCDMLKIPETTAGEKMLKKLQQDLFLIFCAEIFRYFPVEQSSAKMNAINPTKQIPFAVGLSMGLELLINDYIELDDLFDKNAPLGLPTGPQILSASNAISDKLKCLIATYQLYLENEFVNVEYFKKQFPDGVVVSSKNLHIERLETSFGNHSRNKF